MCYIGENAVIKKKAGGIECIMVLSQVFKAGWCEDIIWAEILYKINIPIDLWDWVRASFQGWKGKEILW